MTVENVIKKTRQCNLCGKIIEYTVIENDGRDWCGHQRGSSSSRTEGYECNCTEYKRMCLNCSYYSAKTCYNQKAIDTFKQRISDSVFDVDIKELKIKDPTKHCSHWTVSAEVAKTVFK